MQTVTEKISESRIARVLWCIFVFLMPLTSVPAIVSLVHSDVVAAPSALLLPFLLLIFGLPFLLARKQLLESASSLVLFVLAAITATVISFFYQIPDYKGANPIRSSLTALLTLFIGFCFYLVSLLFHDREERLRLTLQIINISGAMVCIWTLLQALCWFQNHSYPEWMKTVQFTLSVGSLYRQRFVGFTLEPSWLAHQLNLLYLPFWFAASLTGYSAFRVRTKWLTAERVLFAAGMGVLFLTLSRVGLTAFLLTVGFALLVFVHRLVGRIAQKVNARRRRVITIALYAGIFLLLIGASYGLVRLLVKLDFRMAGLFDIRAKGRSDPIFYIAEKLSMAARFVYWDGGIGIFNSHPIFGVGVGHAGYYLPENLNNYAFRLTEVRSLLYRSNTLLNIKSLWIRILAETGIIGFSCFFIWYLRSLLCGVTELRRSKVIKRTAAWMGCFTLIAFLLEGFSLDTFALPYLWFSAGLSTAAAVLPDEGKSK